MSTKKRSYNGQGGTPKATRSIGGKLLTYRPTRPLPGSYRDRQMQTALRRIAEKKGMDTALTLNPIISTTTTNGSAFVLNLIQQGAGSWQRVGRKVNLTSVRLRGTFVFSYANEAVTGSLGGNTVRMVVVWDKQPSGGAIPTFDSIFGVTDQTGTESCTFLNPIKYDNMDRFSVLRDCVVDMSPEVDAGGGTVNACTQMASFDEYIKLGNKEVVFLGQSSPMTIADISTGAIYVYFRVLQNVAGVAEVQVFTNSFARVRYTDL